MDIWFLSREIGFSFGRDGECVRKGRKDMERKVFIACLILMIGLLYPITGNATDVSNETELRDAISRGDSYIRLVNGIDLTSTLTISSGTITLDLNGKTILYDRTGTQENAVAINVNGNDADVIIKNGTIEVRAAKGKNGSWVNPVHRDGYPGYDAVCVQLNAGILSIPYMILVSKPGQGGTRVGLASDGAPGGAYTIDPNTGTVGDMLYGAYIEGASSSDYNNTDGYPGISTTSYTTTVKSTNYSAVFKVDGADIKTISYTLNEGFSYPTYVKKGYTLSSWTSSSSDVKYVTGIPVLATHSATATIVFNATTSKDIYTIDYKGLSDGSNDLRNISTYDIDKGSFDLYNPAKSKTGYDFSTWRDNKDAVTTITYDNVASRSVEKKYTLTAQWTLHTYNIIFDVNVNGTKNATFTINDTGFPEPDADQVPNGKAFDCWYIKGTNTKVEFPLVELKDLQLEAHWKDKTYYASFYDGNIEVNKEPFTVTTGLASFENPDFKEGYIFEYWMDAPANGKKVTSIPTNVSEDKAFYAKWTPIEYTLTYDLSGGSYAGDKTITYTYNERAILLTGDVVSRTGYKLKGWKLGDKLVTEAPVSGGTASDGGRKMSFTITADWELINYDIVFIENGGTPVDDRKYNVKEGVSETDMPKTERAGYNFLGWYNNQDKKVTSITPGSEKLTLTAKWELVVYNITYNLFGGTNPDDAPTTYTYETKAIKLPDPTKEHYTFGGWFTEEELENVIEVIANTSTGNKVFYAKWVPKTYILTFDPCGGRISQTTQQYVYGEVTEFARKPYSDYYDFAGWYYDKAYTQPFGGKITADKSGDHTLYAKWTPAKYEIELNCYYGEFPVGTNEPTSYTYGSTVDKLPIPIREGFSFAGWYADDLLTKPVSSPVVKATDSGNKTFYATWDRGYQLIFTQPSYGKISVTCNGAALPAGTMVGKGESLTVTAEATDANYELKELVIDGKAYTSSPQLVAMPEKDLKITATFTEASTPAASAPEIILTPSGVDKFPKGENVKAQLRKTDEATTLYYVLDGAPEKAYSGEFLIESPKDTILLKAIARKEGYRDGVASRYIIFDNGKITLTFDLPLGVKATNPTGGDVVSATVAGGSFEFKLTVDQSYYTNLDSMVVVANDLTIKAGASGIYTLTNCPSDVTVTVSGLKAKTSTVTLQQTENGKISFTDGAEETATTVDYGATVSITAVADEDFKFLQWNTGSQSNPLKLTVTKDTTISARFISDYKAYAITLPQLEGVTVKPFSGFTTEVKKGGTFKFYLQFANGYHEDNLVVRANGEELTKNKGGYAIYHINKNISISVEGIGRDAMTLKVPEHVNAKVVETMTDVAKQEVYEETLVLLHAEAPTGKAFTKWTDGKTDNPRLSTALDAEQLIPLFDDKGDESYAKVILNQTAGAGITGVNANLDAVKSGDVVQLKVVLLPAYSQSEVVLTADDQKLSPEVSLRAATDTKTYVYKLPVQKDGVTIKVSGLKLNTYDVTMVQMDGGTVSVSPAGKVTHGDKIQLKAQPASGMLFVKWWDGNTLTPYPYTVTSDTEVKAYFLGAESTVDNESIQKEENAQITVSGQTLSVTVAEESMLYVWDYKGSLFRNLKIPAGGYTLILPAGGYLVKVGDMGARKIIIR